MDANFDIKMYRERWKALKRSSGMCVEKHWKQINTLIRFALENGLTRGNDDNEMEDVFSLGKAEKYLRTTTM